ncbi:hypothetical protein Bca4012_004447 [Brassica carinata]
MFSTPTYSKIEVQTNSSRLRSLAKRNEPLQTRSWKKKRNGKRPLQPPPYEVLTSEARQGHQIASAAHYNSPTATEGGRSVVKELSYLATRRRHKATVGDLQKGKSDLTKALTLKADSHLHRPAVSLAVTP